ncbi:hypothetical protein BGZ97_008544 [Linnemannia gamsii]|uniref:Uncharacterized protein n=1 Tax=Linnemannia gamsii TaxID=64522 RepID=A0A9P6RBJ7_9FUNG|nr:hypothetical protein BGZ97_008544 [Linnemannia gamsii]
MDYMQEVSNALLESVLASIVREEFELLRYKLAAHAYPNFSSDSKLCLVIDEAQILSDKNPMLFASSSILGDPRLMLSPCLHAFRTVGLPDEIKVIYCETGLIMKTLHFARSSGDGVKEYGLKGVDSVQAYVDRFKEQLPDNESKAQVDTHILSAAVDMLHRRLVEKFRPIGILETGKWDTAIERTETMIRSWKDRQRRGNLCGELNCLQTKIDDNPKLFTSCPSIKESLGLFLFFRHHLLDAPSTVLENGVQLMGAAYGRTKLFGGIARTVLDETLALKAAINYF